MGRGEPDAAQVAQLREELGNKLNAYEQILSVQSYMAGQTLTLADLFHLPCGRMLFKLGDGDLIESRPHVKKWWDKISSRPSWQAVEKML